MYYRIRSLQHFKHLPQIGEIRFQIWIQLLPWRQKIHIQDVVAMLHKLFNHCSSSLPASSCDNNLLH